jgi:hypothetical protein
VELNPLLVVKGMKLIAKVIVHHLVIQLELVMFRFVQEQPLPFHNVDQFQHQVLQALLQVVVHPALHLNGLQVPLLAQVIIQGQHHIHPLMQQDLLYVLSHVAIALLLLFGSLQLLVEQNFLKLPSLKLHLQTPYQLEKDLMQDLLPPLNSKI